MSFVPGKEDITVARLRAALPSFLILWIAMLLFLVSLTAFFKLQLQEYEIRDVEKRLDGYLAHSPLVTFGLDASRQGGKAGALQGLAFVRLTGNGEQTLLTEGLAEPVDFHRLAGLDPSRAGAWISLADPAERGPWTVVVKTAPSGVRIQAGKVSGGFAHLYDRLVRICRLAAIGGGILALGLALTSVKAGMSPVKKVSEDIAAILAAGRAAALLPEIPADKDLADLYGQLNRLLRHNRQLIAEMHASLDNVAHDLRTPMTRLRAVAEYGLQADADTDRLRDALSDCLEESERVLSMLTIMMSVAEAESGTMQLHREEVDLAASLTDAVSLYEYVAEEKKIEVGCELRPDVRVLADRTRITQVWANLLDNSIKYSNEGGRVAISLLVDGDQAVVVFADDGIGISKNEIPRIWERLYRGDRSRSRPGLGLGLNYVRAVVEAHGGSVGVESELQKGTRLTVRLQRTQPAAPAPDSSRLRSQISGA